MTNLIKHNNKKFNAEEIVFIKEIMPKLIKKGIENGWDIGFILNEITWELRGSIEFPNDLFTSQISARFKALDAEHPKFEHIRENFLLLSKFNSYQLPLESNEKLKKAFKTLSLEKKFALAKEAITNGNNKW